MIFLSLHVSTLIWNWCFFSFHHNLYYLCTFSPKPILVVVKSAPENRSACSVCGKAKGKGPLKESAWSIAYMFTSSYWISISFYRINFFSNTYHPRTSRHFFFFILFLLFYITSKNDATFWCSINEGQEGHLANFHSPLCTNLKRHVFLFGVCNTLNLHVFTFCNHHSLVLFFILLCWKTLRKKQ